MFFSDSIDSFISEINTGAFLPDDTIVEITRSIRPVYIDVYLQPADNKPERFLVKGFKGEMPGNKKSKCYDFLIISKKNLETLVAGKVKDRKKVEYPDTLPNVLSAHILYSIPYSAKMGK